jgi:DNA-binding protein Fis
VIPVTALALHLSLRLSIDRWESVRRIAFLLYVPAAILEYLLLGTDRLVAGFQSFQNFTIIRVPGALYSLFEVYGVLYALVAMVYLVYGARGSRPSVIARIRNRLWLVGLMPLVMLHIYLIVANHYGLAKISSTVSIPIALTFFLAVTTYATHQYRLFDIEFYIPWSKVRKRKTAFYRRIQDAVAEIAALPSVKEIMDYLARALRCQVALVGGPRPLVAFADGQVSALSSQISLSDFPSETLKMVNHIVVANEVADSRPDLHALMKRYKIGAIVPFNVHSQTSAHWMLFGEHFSNEVYTPLDFRVVESLFDKLAERFTDNLLLLRSQLSEANEDVQDYKRRLAIAWEELSALRKQLAVVDEENRELRREKAALLRRQFQVVKDGLPQPILSGEKTLEEYLTATEAAIVAEALRCCADDQRKAARLLGISPDTLRYIISRHRLDTGESR